MCESIEQLSTQQIFTVGDLGWSGNKNIYTSFKNVLHSRQSHSQFSSPLQFQSNELLNDKMVSKGAKLQLSKRIIWPLWFFKVLGFLNLYFTYHYKITFLVKDWVMLKCTNLLPFYIMNAFLALRKGLSRYFYCSPSTCQVWRDVRMATLGWMRRMHYSQENIHFPWWLRVTCDPGMMSQSSPCEQMLDTSVQCGQRAGCALALAVAL